jgi:uncharacterized NAD(P)/FAD-binding protein YdhS
VDIGKKINVHYTPRRRQTRKVVTADFVINCTGPEADYDRIEHPLVINLLRRGLVKPVPAHLGMAALSDGAIVNKDGDASRVVYTLGSTMKGLLWEVLAVPDIRVQAENLARQLLNRDSLQAASL